MNRKIRILIDLDDTLSDFLQTLLNKYNDKYNTNHNISICDRWGIGDLFEHDIFALIDEEEDFFVNVPPKDKAIGSVQVILDNSHKFDVFIVTACNKPEHYIQKVKWVQKWLPSFPIDRIIPTSEKSCIWGDIFIDDNPQNLSDWYCQMVELGYSMIIPQAYMIDMCHNKNNTNFDRVASIYDAILKFGHYARHNL